MDQIGQYSVGFQFWVQVASFTIYMITIGAVLIKTGRLMEVIKNLQVAVLKMDNLDRRLNILDRDSTKKPECKATHIAQENQFCRKIDEIKSIMEKIEEKRDRAVEINDQRWLKVFAKLGEM